VDNGSTDGCVDLFAQKENIRVIRLERNLGFAAANNRGVEAADTTWVALLNPDAFPRPTWLEELLKAAQRHPDAASIGSTQWMHNRPGFLDGAGDVYHACGIAYRRFTGRLGPAPGEGEVFSACAAAALYRRGAFLEAGGFDERLFCYGEDVDLGFRLRAIGYRCVQAQLAEVVHIGSSAAGRHSEFQIYYSVRNRIWVYMKNVPGPYVWLLAPYFLFGAVLHGLSLTRRGRAGAFLRACVDAMRSAGAVWKDRAAVQAARRVRAGKILRAFTWSPFRLFARS
jgi:GT2 family glycosyltransferase